MNTLKKKKKKKSLMAYTSLKLKILRSVNFHMQNKKRRQGCFKMLSLFISRKSNL